MFRIYRNFYTSMFIIFKKIQVSEVFNLLELI